MREVRLATGILVVILVSLILAGDRHVGSTLQPKPSSVALAIPPTVDDVRTLLTNTPLAIAPTEALTLNAARPLDRTPTSFARPFFLPAAAEPPGGTNAALDCLTQAIYYEAASETDTGQRAVAQVVLNRMRSPIFPHTVCGVVYEGSQQRTGCQFSFTCDGSLMRRPSIAGWAHARRIALAALSGSIERSIGLSTHYHANYVVPYWSSSLDKVATIGAHIFYTMRGGLGRPAAFAARYNAGAEAPPGPFPTIAANADAALVDPNETGTLAAAAGLAPNRTVVKDDLLGTPTRAAPVGLAPLPALRADETHGVLVVDKAKGQLTK